MLALVACLVDESLLEHSYAHSLTSAHGCFKLKLQASVSATKVFGPVQPKIVTIRPFAEKACQPPGSCNLNIFEIFRRCFLFKTNIDTVLRGAVYFTWQNNLTTLIAFLTVFIKIRDLFSKIKLFLLIMLLVA